MKITNLKSLSIILSLALLTSCESISIIAKKDSKESETKKIVSTYNDGEVTLKEAQTEIDKLIIQNESLKGLTFDKLNAEQKEVIVKEVVLKKYAYKEAKKRKLNKDEDYRYAVKIFKTELLKQKLFSKIINDATEEENVKKNYDELVLKLKDKKDLRISYISLKTKKEAESLYNILTKNPKSFASQARKKSIDKETAKKGGDLGFVLETALPEEVATLAKSLKKGEISKPIAVKDKWVIIKFEDQKEAKIQKFEDVKEALAQNLAKKAVQDFISKSLEEAKITLTIQ